MAKKIGSLRTLGPELDGVGERVHGLTVSADERTTKIYMFELMLFRLEIGNLSDVVAAESRRGGFSIL